MARAIVDEILEAHDCQEQRYRKLRLRDIVYLLIAMNLFGREGIGRVLNRLQHTWHLLFAVEAAVEAAEEAAEEAESESAPEEKTEEKTPEGGAIHYRRAQLGGAPMVDLFHEVCRPLASLSTPLTKGAFLWEMRTMAIDSKCINLADTPDIDHHFGRPSTDRGKGAFPQARLVTLQEVGTRATVDAGVWPVHTSEQAGAQRLLRSVTADMLVLTDRGFYSFAMITAIAARGAHALCRLPAGVKPRLVRHLADGTALVRIAPAGHHPHKDDEGTIVRLITYTFQDPANPGNGTRYRLVTTLLDPDAFPAQELATAYHERWDIEEGHDEMETHLQHGSGPLRSRSVMGIVQEIYGLLIAHYAVRAAIHEAAVKADIDPDAISFTATVTVLQEAIGDFQMAAPCLHNYLWGRLLSEIASHRVQQRPPRFYPRVVKRKMSNFPLKRKGKSCSKKLLNYEQALCLI